MRGKSTVRRATTRRRTKATTAVVGDDTLLRGRSVAERARFSVDSWEPSLLRAMLAAQGQLPVARADDAEDR